WIIESHRRGEKQTAYQILVASSRASLDKNTGDLWDTGKVDSDSTTQIAYAGQPLTSRQDCYWKVRIWEDGNKPSRWSDAAHWRMGLLEPPDWSAKWIFRPAGDDASDVPYLRKTFTLRAPVKRATLYATALGLYEADINGWRVGDHILEPDWTDYRKRVRYQAFDVTGFVRKGDNAIGALLANGWFAGHIGNGGYQYFGKIPAFLAQLEVTYQDGSSETIATDTSWKWHASPILSSDFMKGETYDAQREIKGWDQPRLDDGSWTNVETRDESGRLLQAQVMQPVREYTELKPKSISEPQPNHWVFDLGQNMVGVVRLKVSAPAGTEITLRHAEMLSPDGTLYTNNLRSAISMDHYTCKGVGTEVWQPRFTFHGFRYVELTGIANKPNDSAVTGIVISSATPQAGSFACSDPRINQLQSNIQWGQRGNYISVPTDCPQRDERLGWMGDAEVFCRTATYNADVAAFFTKWLV